MPAALLSVSDKSGLLDFATGLQALGYTLLSTGGTSKALRAAGLAVTDVADVTRFPEMLDGRVKTLHPAVHGGLLARRDLPEHMAAIAEHGIAPIDLVCVNLYPFEETVAKGAGPEERTEKIDVGGPTMLRAAAKNWRHVAAVCRAEDAAAVTREMEETGGLVCRATRHRLAGNVFARTASYDAAIAADFAGGEDAEAGALPAQVDVRLRRVQSLRYGENPHQAAALYSPGGTPAGELPGGWRKLAGEELSYNNWIDLVAAAELALAFPGTSCAIIKHTNPCGTAVRERQLDAWDTALASDPVSAFGGIAAFNRPLEADTAAAAAKLFLEVIVAPEFTPGALEALHKKSRLRLVQVPVHAFRAPRQEWKALPGGGFLMQQDPGRPLANAAEWKVASKRPPTAKERADLEFAWTVCASVKSNAIVFARDGRSLAVGAGQMSRVDSVRIAIEKARELGHDLRGSVLASDAFFPFPDGPALALDAGVTAIAQPGGSKRDDETIAVVDERGAAMVLTGRRIFRH